MQLRKFLTGLLAACITAASLSVAAAAIEPSYKVSDDYKDTLYYNNLAALELTGDGATDVIAVALSQLGYHEGNKDSEKDGLNNSGSKNFVEYNVLFGKLDNGEGNGYSYGYAWCAAFVNWCLRQARVDKELTGGMYVSCASWRNWFINEGAKFGASYHARNDDYIPQKGDLIFYKSLNATHSRATDHIGIVLKSENGKVYAIEGHEGLADQTLVGSHFRVGVLLAADTGPPALQITMEGAAADLTQLVHFLHTGEPDGNFPIFIAHSSVLLTPYP